MTELCELLHANSIPAAGSESGSGGRDSSRSPRQPSASFPSTACLPPLPTNKQKSGCFPCTLFVSSMSSDPLSINIRIMPFFSCHLNFKVNLYFVIKHIKGMVMSTPLLRIPFPGGFGLLLVWQTFARPPPIHNVFALSFCLQTGEWFLQHVLMLRGFSLEGSDGPVPLSQTVISLAHRMPFICVARR